MLIVYEMLIVSTCVHLLYLEIDKRSKPQHVLQKYQSPL